MNNKIKVCHFTSAHPSDDIRIFHKECVSLASAGYEVYLVTANGKEGVFHGVNVVSVKTTSSNRFIRMMKTSKAVYKKALSLDADIYHFHDPELLPFALRIKRKGKKVIYDAHEDVPRQILSKFWIPSILRKTISFFFEKFENRVAKRLSYVVVSTPTIKNRFIQVNSKTEDICNYPLLKENLHIPSWSTRKTEICYIGGITRIRGVFELVESLRYTEGVRLNIAGAFSPESLKQELQAKDEWTKVNDCGFVGREEVSKILNTSKIGIVTLYPQPNYLESLPIKMFEYMLSGIPVIASDFPLWRQIIEDAQCGVCVNPKDPKEIADKINQLLNDDALAERMGQNGREAVLNEYNWGVQETKLLAIYKSLS